MANKISFPQSNDWGVIGPDGDFKLPVSSVLGHRFQLVDGKVIDHYDGVSDDEVQKIDEDHAQQKQADELQAARKALVIRIKTEAGQRITSLNWKVDRARERDVLNRTSTLQEVYAEREAIRAASNEAETAIAELAFFDDIRDFTW